MAKLIDRMLEKTIPVVWFALLLGMWVVTSTASYISNAETKQKWDAFISQGGRFTAEDGKKVHEQLNIVFKNQAIIMQDLEHLKQIEQHQ